MKGGYYGEAEEPWSLKPVRFEPAHMRGDRRLGESEEVGRFGKAADLADGHEGAKQLRRDAGPPRARRR